MIPVYIPTKGRTNKQPTWDSLPGLVKNKARVVCPVDEHDIHLAMGRRPWICAHEGISKTRQFICEWSDAIFKDGKLMMADDDQRWLRRITPDDWHLKQCTETDLLEMFRLVDRLLDKYAMVGISARQGNNNMSGGIEENTRICNSYGVRADILALEGIRFDETPLMEDFNVALSLMRKGYPVAMITEFAWDQGQSNAPGGCSTYRDSVLQKQAAEFLADKHAPHVKLVTKTTKWVGMETRTDVQVQWKKAFKEGVDQFGGRRELA